MLNSKKFKVLALAVIFSLLIPFGSSSAFVPSSSSSSEELETLQLEIKYNNGDRADAYQTYYVVYQDHNKTPFLEKNLETNPDFISLPKDHQYQIKIFVNGIFSESGFIELKNEPEKLNINIPLSGGIKFSVFFEGGETPINNATVIIKSNDGKEQLKGNTNQDGDTMRYWLQPTMLEGDYYEIDVYHGDLLLTSVSNIKVNQGISQDQKIVVPIPEVIEELITFRLYDKESQKILKNDGSFSVLLVSQNNVHIKESTMSAKGEVYFSNLSSGIYTAFVLRDGLTDATWEDTKIVITGKQVEFDLFQSNVKELLVKPITETTVKPITETTVKPIIYEPSIKEYTLSCNCISFRMDDIQDYWLNNSQTVIIDLFSKHNIPLTIGVLIGDLGDDPTIVDVVKNGIKNGNLEIANHSLTHTPVTEFTKQQLDEMIKKSQKEFNDKLNVTPTVFIPPLNEFNDDTLPVLIENGFTAFSSSDDYDPPPYPLQNESIYRFAQGSVTGHFDPSLYRFVPVPANQTFSKILDSIKNNGYSVTTIHPQEISVFVDGVATNEINFEHLQEVENLLQRVKAENIQVVPIGQIENNISKVFVQETELDPFAPHTIPTWLKNNAGWWRDGQINDVTFVNGIQFLIKEQVVPIVPTTEGTGSLEIPSWVKVNAGLWADGKIPDEEFILGLTFLVNQEIIIVDI